MTQNIAESIALVKEGKAAYIYVDQNGKDYDGLSLAANSLAKDINMVTEIYSKVTSSVRDLKETAIIAGSVGNNAIIDSLIAKKIIDASSIKNKRECYKLQVVENLTEDVKKAIIIVGSDKRGTIYGIYHISELIGVSPWIYFADVIPAKQSEILLPEEKLNLTSKEPSVKYRGFFLNDEWPSLGSWVFNKFGGFNEKFYDHVFELLLRLKGNYLWPAMWSAIFSENGKESPIANAKHADAYGIIMGTSHHEPLFRAGEEWRKVYANYGTNNLWDFSKNAEAITKFWEDGLLRNKTYENIITLGMRGECDSALEGSDKENIDLLKKIILTQKDLLKKHNLEKQPQVLTIYKEVEKYWYGTKNAEGLKDWEVLDDVTIMLAEDNFGNVRTLPSKENKTRKAGWGMYYHFDYHGGPNSYEWVNTTPIEKVWEQMSMAYEYGVRDIWIVNVGDLKPMEFPISYFLDLAYDFDTLGGINGINKTEEYTKKWVSKQFKTIDTEETISGIADVLSSYTRMNGKRKPEVTYPSTYSYTNYNEAQRVLKEAIILENKAKKYLASVPESYKDTYYQLAYYPAAASANIVKLNIFAGLNKFYYNSHSILANSYANLTQSCIEKDTEMQNYYNTKMSAGKWEGIMSSPHIGYTNWNADGWKYPEINHVTPKNEAIMLINVQGAEKAIIDGTAVLPTFTNLQKECYYIILSNGGNTKFEYKIESSTDWIKIDSTDGTISTGKALKVFVDWNKLSCTSKGLITIIGAGQTVEVEVIAEVISIHDMPNMTFIETHNTVSIEAEHISNNVSKSGVEWKVIENYGRSLASLKMFPADVSFEDAEAAPYLEYNIYVNSNAEYTLTAFTAPTNNLSTESRLRYAAAFDKETPVIKDVLAKDFIAGDCHNDPWSKVVLDNIHVSTTSHKLTKGLHTLRFYGIDAGLVLQKLILSKDKLPESYFGAEESYYVGKEVNQKSAIIYGV